MKRRLYEVWKEMEGSKVIWKVQFPNGVMWFRTKKDAKKCAKVFSV